MKTACGTPEATFETIETGVAAALVDMGVVEGGVVDVGETDMLAYSGRGCI